MKNSGFRFAPRSLFTVVAAAGVGMLLGCPFTNESHCSLNAGACGEGLMCSMCAADNNGCVAPDVIETACLFGGSTTGTSETVTSTTAPTTAGPSDTSTTTSSPTFPTSSEPTTMDVTLTVTSDDTGTSTTTSTTDPMTDSTNTTEMRGCDPEFGNDQCAQPTPYCVETECVSCTQVPCAQVDPEKPACVEETGQCVQCVDNGDCSESAPYCDPDSATCKKCSMHEHCSEEAGGPGTACNLDDGVCFPADNVVWVDNTTGAPVLCNNNNPGTEEEPLCLLSYAFARAMPGKPLTIKVRPGVGLQSEFNAVTTASDVALIGIGSDNVLLTRNGPESALYASGGARVYVHKISMYNPIMPINTNVMIDCKAATVWLDEVRVYNSKVGIRADNCVNHYRRVVIYDTVTGAVTLTNQAKLFMENSFITRNGTIHGLNVTNGSSADILYSTLALNSGTVAPITCTNASNTVGIRNSFIAYAGDKATTCTLKEDLNNFTGKYATIQALISDMVAASIQQGVIRAQTGGKLKDVAEWKDGDPREDFDSPNKRPAGEMNKDYAGADVP